MKKIILTILLVLTFLLPVNSLALSNDYKDVVSEITGAKVVDGVVNIYFFHGDGCPHCAKEEEFLKTLEEKYKGKINILRYETWQSTDNYKLMVKVKEALGETSLQSVPFTVIGEKKYLGYDDKLIGEPMEKVLQSYLGDGEEETVVEQNTFKIPLIGEVDVRETSIFLIAIIFGLVDGFNPCAMWILLFLINMLFDMKDKKRMIIFGITFLFVSGLVYFLSMLGITSILSVLKASIIRTIIGIVGLALGIYNIKKYLDNRKKDNGCTVVDAKKRKKIFNRIKKFTREKNFFLALMGVILLAISVNIVELACSSVFPATFSEILALNKITGLYRILYLVIYVIFYMLDDMVIFVTSVSALEVTVNNTKYAKFGSLISGIIMVIMGILLIFKPGWVMFNF